MFVLNFEVNMRGPGTHRHLCSCVGSCEISSLAWGDQVLNQQAGNLVYPHAYLSVYSFRSLQILFYYLCASVFSVTSWITRVEEWHIFDTWATLPLPHLGPTLLSNHLPCKHRDGFRHFCSTLFPPTTQNLEEGWKVKVKSLTGNRLCDPMDCSLPCSSVHGIFQARLLEWVAISFSRDLPDPGIKPRSPGL